MTAELHMLTGAYALDAVSDVDRAEFERHLGECDACRQEVAELRATGARLGVAAAVDPPPSLKLVVLADVARTRQLPPRVPVVRRLSRAKTWQVRFALFGAAAAAVVAVVFGVVTTPAPVDSVLSAPDAAAVQGVGQGHATLVVSRSRNQAVLLASDLPALDAGHVYQVWLIGGGGARSAGLMQPESPGRMRPMLADLPPGVDRIGITVEPAGGSPGPTTPAVSRIDLA
ncbi:anti-sigma factor [Amycolatopsis kentuckyensis]|uniref:anti-sigma factor n=1 Tax=Amycolatopsis kentuckyensis TaxID=218823 RepID=UPI000A3D41E5|nr:anti-sigma factor [Amycolatopsis kentuckyensis]